MTITYTAEVATCTGLGCFWKLLFRWRGSIYKLLWPNLIVYSVVYFSLSGIYRFLLTDTNRLFFEKVSLHCQAYGDLIPIAFVLGFYVSIVIKRWWDQYICMPWPDNLAMFVSTLVHGQDDRGRLMRRTIIRYVNLCLVITLRMMSPRVKKRFPTLDHLVEAGFLQPNEKKIFEDLDQKTSHPKYWMPLVWAGGIITRARKEGRVKDDFSMKTLIDELNIFRGGCGGMLNYDWISIPLVYTQVVTLAVYVYFMASLMGNQFLDPEKGYAKHEVDLVVPVFTFLQFFFYMGWLKVAESLVNPFGEDDDDFELNWLVDRNLQVSYVIVDEMHQEHPEMVKDQYWDEVFPAELPYTAASKQYQTGPPPGSTDNVEVSLEQAEFMPLETVQEEMPQDGDDLDMDLDVEDPSSRGSRRETHPMRILTRQKSGSVGSMNTSSFSGPRHGRKSSVLNMLTRIFRREGSSRDLEEELHQYVILEARALSSSASGLCMQVLILLCGLWLWILAMTAPLLSEQQTEDAPLQESGSQMGSSVSLPSRRAPRSSSRMSSMSQSQAQSRTSIVRENTFQDEMFRMSDVSLCGSAETTGSQIQLVVSTHHGDVEEDAESSEAAQLIPGAREWSRRMSKDKCNVTEIKTADLSLRDDASDASGSSIKTSYYQEWNVLDAPESTPLSNISPQPRLMESYRHAFKAKQDWKDTAPISPSVTFTETSLMLDSTSSTMRIITPNSPPIRQTFTPVIPIVLPVGDNKQKRLETRNERYSQSFHGTSSLSRSLQQQPMLNDSPKSSIMQSAEIAKVGSVVPSKLEVTAPAEAELKVHPVSVITILPPISTFFTSTTLHAAYSQSLVTPSVSLPSALTPTTSMVTMMSSSQTSVTTTSTTITSPVISATIVQMSGDITDTSGTVVEQEDGNLIVQQTPPEKPPVPPDLQTVEEHPTDPTLTLDLDQSVPPSSGAGPPQYVPSAAIPVPSVSPAHASTSATLLENGYEMIEAALVPMSRRTHHDFHELEPISEHGETSTESPMASKCKPEEPPPDLIPTESTV